MLFTKQTTTTILKLGLSNVILSILSAQGVAKLREVKIGGPKIVADSGPYALSELRCEGTMEVFVGGWANVPIQ